MSFKVFFLFNRIENLELENWLKTIIKILYLFFLFVMFAIPISIIFIKKSNIDYKKMNSDVYFITEYSGVISKKYIDYSNHGGTTIRFKSGEIMPINPKLYYKLNIDDSIFKKEKNSKTIIYKKDGTIDVFILK
jgi:hypothetical protein